MPIGVERAFDRALGDPRLAQVAADRKERHPGLLAELLRRHREPILLNIADNELRPLFRKPLCDDTAKPLRGAGHDRDPSLIPPTIRRLGKGQCLQRRVQRLFAHSPSQYRAAAARDVCYRDMD